MALLAIGWPLATIDDPLVRNAALVGLFVAVSRELSRLHMLAAPPVAVRVAGDRVEILEKSGAWVAVDVLGPVLAGGETAWLRVRNRGMVRPCLLRRGDAHAAWSRFKVWWRAARGPDSG